MIFFVPEYFTANYMPQQKGQFFALVIQCIIQESESLFPFQCALNLALQFYQKYIFCQVWSFSKESLNNHLNVKPGGGLSSFILVIHDVWFYKVARVTKFYHYYLISHFPTLNFLLQVDFLLMLGKQLIIYGKELLLHSHFGKSRSIYLIVPFYFLFQPQLKLLIMFGNLEELSKIGGFLHFELVFLVDKLHISHEGIIALLSKSIDDLIEQIGLVIFVALFSRDDIKKLAVKIKRVFQISDLVFKPVYLLQQQLLTIHFIILATKPISGYLCTICFLQ